MASVNQSAVLFWVFFFKLDLLPLGTLMSFWINERVCSRGRMGDGASA